MACTHERDDLGYPVSAGMCDACKATSKAMNNRFILGVLDGADLDRSQPKNNDDEELGT